MIFRRQILRATILTILTRLRLMDVLSGAIEVAKGVRVIIAAYKGESNVIIAARQLMRSCQLYEDCLTTLLASLQEQSRAASYVGSAAASTEFQHEIQHICLQVKGDKNLLDEILAQSKSIAESTKSKGYAMNVLTTLLTGRVNKIKELEGALMTRVSLVTALMMKSVFKAAQGLDLAAVASINDVDGSLFWQAHFGVSRQVSFQRFLEAYQMYLTNTFVFRRLRKQQLMVLLGNTLLDRQTAELSKPLMATNATLLNTEVSLESFGLWLRRFGPMKDTLTKCSAVTLPSTSRCVSWFRPWMSRAEAEAAIERQLKASVVSPADLFIVRYSADPKVTFVISTRPPGFPSIEHYPISNSGSGYTLTGDTSATAVAAPTLLDCVQVHIFNRLFLQTNSRANCNSSSGNNVELSRQSLDEWSAVFAEVTAELPADHYRSGKELDEAMKNASLLSSALSATSGASDDWGSAAASAVPVAEAQFASLFEPGAVSTSLAGADDDDEQQQQEGVGEAGNDAGDEAGTGTGPGASKEVLASESQGCLPTAAAVVVQNPTTSVPAGCEAKVVGAYMIKHGVSVLRSAKVMSAEDAESMMAILQKYE